MPRCLLSHFQFDDIQHHVFASTEAQLPRVAVYLRLGTFMIWWKCAVVSPGVDMFRAPRSKSKYCNTAPILNMAGLLLRMFHVLQTVSGDVLDESCGWLVAKIDDNVGLHITTYTVHVHGIHKRLAGEAPTQVRGGVRGAHKGANETRWAHRVALVMRERRTGMRVKALLLSREGLAECAGGTREARRRRSCTVAGMGCT